MRQASRLYERREALDRAELMTVEADDILASSVFDDADGELAQRTVPPTPQPS
jgi:hypothetical protein